MPQELNRNAYPQYLFKGNVEAALDIFTHLGEETTHNTKPITALGYAHSISGDKAKARECLEELINNPDEFSGVSMSIDFATLYAGLGEMDKAFEYLEKCMKENPILTKYVTQITFFESLKTMHNKLWSEELQKMIGWKEYYAMQRMEFA